MSNTEEFLTPRSLAEIYALIDRDIALVDAISVALDNPYNEMSCESPSAVLDMVKKDLLIIAFALEKLEVERHTDCDTQESAE